VELNGETGVVSDSISSLIETLEKLNKEDADLTSTILHLLRPLSNTGNA